MLARELKAEQFATYEPEAKRLATEYIATLQRLPLSFLPNLLREVADYDFKFPVERRALEGELAKLRSLSPQELEEWFRAFTEIRISPELERSDWARAPAQFVEQLSAYLWTTHQLDAFRAAAVAYADRMRAAVPPEPPSIPRIGITIIGQGVNSFNASLFRKLRNQGAYFSNINPENGLKVLLEAVGRRAKEHPVPYAHWYVDGGQGLEHEPSLACVSYGDLEPARAALLRKMRAQIERPGMGPEALRTFLAQLRPQDVGLGGSRADAVLDRFRLKVLSEGSGTQIFSTTFVQWTAREALRRAQPVTLLVRYAPRQRQKPMNELLAATQERVELDPLGSLIDGDMGAYYNWLNQQRLPGADRSSFLVWFESHSYALAIGPSVPRGTESSGATSVKELLSWVV